MSSLSGASLNVIEKLEEHPNADRLEIVRVQGCPAIVGKGEFEEGESVVFLPFDTVVPEDPAFPEFVRGKRVRALRLRGIFSMGVVLKNVWGFAPTDDIDARLGLAHWEPLVTDGEAVAGPPLFCPTYDLESLRKYHHLLVDGEEVAFFEKLHGQSSRYVYLDGELHVGSRGRWLKEGGSACWRVARDLNLKEKLVGMEGYVLYGEVYGVQDLRYGLTNGGVGFVAFDLYNPAISEFWPVPDFLNFCSTEGIPRAPLLYRGPWLGLDAHKNLAEGPTLLNGGEATPHVREGFVVKPFVERRDDTVGRVALKLHGEGYLTR